VYLSNEVTAALAGAIIGALLSPIGSWFLDYKKERKQQKELLANFKQELISNYRNSEYNKIHVDIEPDLPMNRLKSEALEGLSKKDWFPKSWDKESKEKITRISKAIEDVNRAIKYREDPRVIANEGLFKKQNEVISKESSNLSSLMINLSRLSLDGLGQFTDRCF
jgi:hypothetical protein